MLIIYLLHLDLFNLNLICLNKILSIKTNCLKLIHLPISNYIIFCSVAFIKMLIHVIIIIIFIIMNLICDILVLILIVFDSRITLHE